MRHQNVLVLGGAGFIGRYLVNLLVGRGYRVLVPTRRRARARHLIMLPTCDVVEADVHDPASLGRLVAGQDAVVNFIGVLHAGPGTPYGPEFLQAHVELPRKIVAACEKHGVRRFLQTSALGADSKGPSMYQRSRGDGDRAAMASKTVATTVFRPSIVFGREDNFLNLFAKLALFAPFMPIGGARSRLQPIWVEDVALAMANALDDARTFGKIYELAGPTIYTLADLVRFATHAAGHPRAVIALPDRIARLQARLLEMLPGPTLMSRDNLDSLKVDNIASVQPFRPAPELGIELHALEPIATQYLAGLGPRARLAQLRMRAHRT